MLIDWKKIAQKIYDDIKVEVAKNDKKPSLWAILVWEDSSSLRYINQKMKWADFTWINLKLEQLDKNISEVELLAKIKEFNNDKNINWYIVQLPLPKHINSTKILNEIDPKKDIDGFHPNNQWKVLIWDNTGFVPCTPAWIMEIFNYENIVLEWKNVCVVGRSNIVWKPIISLLINAWATVLCCNSKTKNLDKMTSQADIIIVATGQPNLLKVSMAKVWATIIDVWFTVIDWKIYWDCETKLFDLMWSKITPVPGWVWALTVSMLMKNTLKAFKLQN